MKERGGLHVFDLTTERYIANVDSLLQDFGLTAKVSDILFILFSSLFLWNINVFRFVKKRHVTSYEKVTSSGSGFEAASIFLDVYKRQYHLLVLWNLQLLHGKKASCLLPFSSVWF